MMREDDNFDNILREKLRNWAPDPPAEVWNAIQMAQKRRRRLVIYRITSIAAAILLLLGLPLLINRQHPEHHVVPATEKLSTELSTTQQPQPASQTTGIQPALDAASALQPAKTDATRRPTIQQSLTTDDISAIILKSDDMVVVATPEAIQLTEQITPTPEQVRQAVEEMLAKLRDEFPVNDSNTKDHQVKRFSLGMAYNFAPATITGKNGLFSNIMNYRYGPDPFQGNIAHETRYFKDIEETRLEAPISLGLKISVASASRLAFETGLSYTRLNTFTKTYPLDEVYVEYNQSLYYLGVPIGMRYDWLQTRLINLYTAQNVMIEKGVAAINSINKFEKDKNIGKMRQFESIGGFQLSTTTSAGAGLHLNKYLSFYAEGGVQIFYLNHTQPFNIRSSKKIWPVFQSGIRVNL
ncbi:MAG TPA: hypothetical protein PKE03_01235 [Bacteroidales bacterium]|nr:hypothetical protein [Bacteroidales bacterium]